MENLDVNFKQENNSFNVRVSVIIIKNKKLLVQKRKNDLVWALPGGKVKIMEKTEDAIKREIKEELNVELSNIKIVSVTENFFRVNNEKIHQYIFTYKGDLIDDEYDDLEEFGSVEIEKNVIYRWIKLDEIDNFEIRPNNIKEQLENMRYENISFYITK